MVIGVTHATLLCDGEIGRLPTTHNSRFVTDCNSPPEAKRKGPEHRPGLCNQLILRSICLTAQERGNVVAFLVGRQVLFVFEGRHRGLLAG